MPTDLTPADSTATAEPRPELLGRTHELAELERHLGTAPESPAGPRGRAALVAGDAGLGKTRLLTELAERARASGWTVMIGHCLDFADQLLPYLPFSEMLGRLADDDPESAARIAERHPAITALAPGRRLMSGAEPPAPLDGAGLRDARPRGTRGHRARPRSPRPGRRCRRHGVPPRRGEPLAPRRT